MIPGAAAIFDDYGFEGCEGVTRFVESLKVGTLIHNLNGHAVIIKNSQNRISELGLRTRKRKAGCCYVTVCI
jgi:hypothetical protein